MSRSGLSKVRSSIVGITLTTVFCVAVAALLVMLGVSTSFDRILVISLSIGLSLHFSSMLLAPRLAPIGRWFLGPVVVAVVGIGVGVALAGVFIDGNALLFFSRDYGTLLISVFFGVLGLFLFSTREDLLKARAELAEARAATEHAARRTLETELRLLQAQIEPHFLFNTLSNVVSLVRSDPVRAEATLHNLARLLRTSLRRSRSATATLGDELDLVVAYLEIQQVRMGERLCWQVEVPVELRELSLPPMLLQPLVENAVLHGIEPLVAGGRISIRAQRDQQTLQLSVIDTGAGLDAISAGGGVGLANVRERLEALYGTSASLDLGGAPGGGVAATLRLPCAA